MYVFRCISCLCVVMWVGWEHFSNYSSLVLVFLPYGSPFLLFFCNVNQCETDVFWRDFFGPLYPQNYNVNRWFCVDFGLCTRIAAHAIAPKGFLKMWVWIFFGCSRIKELRSKNVIYVWFLKFYKVYVYVFFYGFMYVWSVYFTS